jgi:transposase-like protein
MKSKHIRSQSRRRTPWDHLSEDECTPLQAYLRDVYQERFAYHHQSLGDMNDNAVFDKYTPESCPYCGSVQFVRNGHYKATGLQRYKCKDCLQSFCITTKTIFEDHKISIGEWLHYLLNLFDYVSLNAGSKNNKNAFTTSRYWLQKIFLVLEDYQDDIMLSGKVYLDETFYAKRKRDLARKENGKLLRGISSNQICIATAADKRRVYCKVEGEAKPTSEKTLEIFKEHIRKRSTLIHDGDASHNELVNALRLKQEIHYSADTKGLDDTDNPLDRINDVHSLLKIFLDSHSGFLREYLQDYLNLFVLISNPPYNKLEKADLFLERALRTRASLKYRDFYKCDKTKEDASGYDE